jgi:hypothetical protein
MAVRPVRRGSVAQAPESEAAIASDRELAASPVAPESLPVASPPLEEASSPVRLASVGLLGAELPPLLLLLQPRRAAERKNHRVMDMSAGPPKILRAGLRRAADRTRSPALEE